MYFSWLVFIALFTFAASTLYFYIFSRKQEKFMQYWGFSWIAYSMSLLCLLCFFASPNDLFLELRKVVDMFNLLLLLFGSYSYTHIKVPTYWYRFSLYLLLLAVICMIYSFDLLSFYLPISIYQLIITAFLCYNIWQKWDIIMAERIIASVVFFLWGAIKSVFSIAETVVPVTSSYYVTEILMSNLVNFCIMVIYVVYTQQESSLASSLYRTVVDNSKDVIFYYKLQPYEAFKYISPSIREVTGYPQSAFYDNPNMFQTLTSHRQAEEIRDLFTAKFPARDRIVIEMTNKNGESFWGEFTCTIIRKKTTNEPIALEGSFRDITSIKSAELNHIEATKSRNMLLSYISHELRTPITSIAGYLTAISDGTISSREEKHEAMEIITAKTLILKKLVDDLGQLSKMQTHQFTFDFTLCTITDTADLLITSNIGDARAARFEISIDYDEITLSHYWAVLDLDRINQVFSNLITNAIKYSDAHKEIHITFKVDDAAENFIVSVSDKGMGIRESQLAHVFDQFYRAENNQKNGHTQIEGRGLGLTLCKEIMLAHQGDIYAESTFGEGSTFTFIIPLYKEV